MDYIFYIFHCVLALYTKFMAICHFAVFPSPFECYVAIISHSNNEEEKRRIAALLCMSVIPHKNNRYALFLYFSLQLMAVQMMWVNFPFAHASVLPCGIWCECVYATTYVSIKPSHTMCFLRYNRCVLAPIHIVYPVNAYMSILCIRALWGIFRTDVIWYKWMSVNVFAFVWTRFYFHTNTKQKKQLIRSEHTYSLRMCLFVCVCVFEKLHGKLKERVNWMGLCICLYFHPPQTMHTHISTFKCQDIMFRIITRQN